MSCLYSDQEGQCTLYSSSTSSTHLELGCDLDGYCICEDDPDPEYTCEHYEDMAGDDEEYE